jgi:hypothetical protein
MSPKIVQFPASAAAKARVAHLVINGNRDFQFRLKRDEMRRAGHPEDVIAAEIAIYRFSLEARGRR